MKKRLPRYGVNSLPARSFTYNKPLVANGVIPWDRDFSQVVERINNDAVDASSESTSFQRIYDEGVRDWLKGLAKPNGNEVAVMMSSPRTAFADYKIALMDATKDDRYSKLNAGMPRQFPLPFICFTRGDVAPRSSQRNQWVIRSIGFVVDGPNGQASRRKTGYARWPQPLFITYQVNIWSLTRPVHDLFQARIMEQFTNTQASMWVRNPYKGGRPVYAALKFSNLDDMTEFEGDTSRDCLFRLSLNFKVEAWQFFDIMAAPTVLSQSEPVIVEGSDGSNQQVDTVLNTPLVSYAPVPPQETGAPGDIGGS